MAPCPFENLGRTLHKAVKSSQCGVACDTCNIWYHTTCMHMSSTTYESLDNISWHCASCITQFTSSLRNSPTSVNNSFSSLDISASPTNNRLASQPTATAQRRHAHKPFKIININFQSIKNKTAELGISSPNLTQTSSLAPKHGLTTL